MTSPSGGGAANLGTVTGKVRINYESTNARAAVREAENFQATLADVGRTATMSAKQVDRAGGMINQFGRMLDRLGQRVIPNPAQGLGTRVENETQRATKALANLQRTAAKGGTVGGNLRVSPTRVEIDRRAIDNALRNGNFGRLNITAPIRLTPSQVELDRRSIENAVRGVSLQRIVLRTAVHIEPTEVSVNQGAISRAVGSVSGASASGGGEGGGGGAGLAGIVPMLGRITAGAGAAAVAVGSVGMVLTKGFSRLNQIDDATVKLSAMGKSMQEIQAISSASLKAVEGTAFGLNEAFNTAADAINAGIKPGEQLNKYLTATANTASLAGVGMQELGQAFSQAAIEGKLTGDVFQMLVNRQVPVLKLLADEYGVTQQQAREMVSDGTVSFDRFMEAMSKTGGAAKAMGNTIGGSFKNLGAAVSRLGANLLAPLFGKKDADDANLIASAIQKVTGMVDWLGKTVKNHYGGIVSFWEALAKGGLIAAKAFTGIVGFLSDAIVKITEMLGDLAGWVTQTFAKVADLVGADGIAEKARGLAEDMHSLGEGLRENRDINMGKMNRGIDSAYAAVERWADGARNATNNTGDLGDAAEAATPKMISLKDALDKLKISAESAEAALMGSNEQFREFLDKVKDAGGSQQLLDTLRDIRNQFENGGRAVKAYADAIGNLRDTTLGAADRANALITALQGLGVLPRSTDTLQDLNEQLESMTSYMSQIIDLADTTGNALVNLDGTLNVGTKNGRALVDQIEELRSKAGAAVVEGYDPNQVYETSAAAIRDLLVRQAGLTGDAAQQVIDKYLPKDFLTKQLQETDPAQGLKDLKLDSELNLLTTTQDILGQIVGPDGKLHVPTVLDVQAPTSTSGNPPVQGPPLPPPTNAVPPSAGPGPTIAAKPGEDPSKPLSAERRKELGIPDNFPPIYPSAAPGTAGPSPATVPANPVPTSPPPGAITPNDLSGLLGASDPNGLATDPAQRKQFMDLANNKAALDKALADNPEIAKQLQSLVDQANAQGQNMGVAFADGLMNGSEEVRAALLKLAGMAGDYLGNSPAKYGPLSGKGWTLYRGKTFSVDYAKGIVSEADAVSSAVSGTADAAVGALAAGGAMPLNDQVTQLLKDFQEVSDFGKHILDFANQVSDIAFGFAKVANDLSGGKLFPKTYTKDDSLTPGGSAVQGLNITPRPLPNTTSGTTASTSSAGTATGGGGTAVPLVQNPDGTWTSTDPEWAKLIKRESGGNPKIVQGVIDANSGGNEASGLFQIAKGTWASNGGTAFAPTAGEATPEQQAQIAAKIFNEQGGRPWGSGKGQNLGREDEDLLRAGLNGAVTAPAAPAAGVAQRPNGPAPEGQTWDYSLGKWVPAPGSAVVSQQSGTAQTEYGLPAGTDTGGYGTGNAKTFPPWFMALADQFGVLPSTYEGHQETDRGEKGYAANPNHENRGIDWSGPVENMQKFAEYLASIAPNTPGLEQIIWRNPQTGQRIGLGGQGNLDPGYYPDSTYADHENHVHTRQSLSIPLPGTVPSALGGAPSGAQSAMPVALSDADRRPLLDVAANTSSLPSMPSGVRSLIENNAAIQNLLAKGANATESDVVPALQSIDGLIADQNRLGTPQAKAYAQEMDTFRSSIMSQHGMKEGPTMLDQAQGIAQSVSGIASDVFGLIDQGLKVVGATHDIGNVLVRGIENTKDVNRIIDNVQEFVTLAAKGFQTAGNITSMVGSIMSIGAGADFGASGGVSAAGQILGLVGQGIAAVNTGIDIAQDAYKITTKYVGRFIQSSLGLSGASDVRFLLDEVTGKVAAYSSDNPQQKTWMNTLGRSLGADYPNSRPTVVNNNTVYQGPGQDPRDTMDDMMFSVRASGVGAFGYAV